MAVPTGGSTKTITPAADGYYSARLDGAPGKPSFTLSAGSTSLTATITDGQGASSYEIRTSTNDVTFGSAVSGLVASGLPSSTLHYVQVRGIHNGVTGDWSDSLSDTTDAAGTWTEGDEPVVSSVTGTFGAGTLTISGSNFSTKKTDGQILFKDFSNLTTGANVSTDPDLDEVDAVGGDYPYIVKEGGVFGPKYIESVTVQNSLPTINHDFGVLLDEVYLEAWKAVDLVDFTDPSGPQIKDFRLIGGTGSAQSDSPGVGVTFNAQSDTAIYQYTGPGEGTTTTDRTWFGEFRNDGNWEKIVHYLKVSDPDVANGKRYSKTSAKQGFTALAETGHYASPSNAISLDEWDGDAVVTRATGSSSTGIGHLHFPFYMRSEQSANVRIAWVFANNSPERVAVGTQSTWIGCNTEEGKRFILPQTSRATGEIVVDSSTVGPIEATDDVYLYVVNRDGKYNTNGVLIRAGSV